MPMKTRNSDICVICGKQPHATREHIPPQAIFPKPRPGDTITVPACASCNNGTSDLDEAFKVFIGFAGGHGPDGERMFKEQTARTLDHNQRLKNELASTIRDIEVETPEGIVKRPAVFLDTDAHDKVVEKMIRGLHFYHTGKILGDKANIKVRWHRSLTEKQYNLPQNWGTGVVGKGQFIYKYITFPEEPLASIWIFQFFWSTWFSGTVLPI